VLGSLPASAFCGLTGLIVRPVCAQPAAVLRSSAFRSFGDAVARWSGAGGTLIVDRDHIEAAPVTMRCVPGLSYHLTSDRPRTVAYAGPHFHWSFCIYSEGGNPFVVDGALTFDGQNRCSIPFFARFETVSGRARRDFRVDGLVTRNARMKRGTSRVDGSPMNAYGATGMAFSGGFDRLHLRRVRSLDIAREAAAGLPGHQGCVGIAVSGGGIVNPKHVTIEDFEVVNINSDDRPDSRQRGDMDGVLVFQAPEAEGSRPVIQRGTIREAAGRAIKVYAPGGGGVTRDIEVYRSVHGNTGGSNDIAHQHGDGTIENVAFHYSGDAHSQPTIPIGMSSGHLRERGFPFRRGVVRGITIHDTTGRAKRAIATMFFNLRDASPRAYLIADVQDHGSAEHLFLPGALGSFGDAAIEIDQVSVNLTIGLMATEDYDRRLTVTARALVNRNPRPVPFKVGYNGQAAPPGHGGTLVADNTVIGVIR